MQYFIYSFIFSYTTSLSFIIIEGRSWVNTYLHLMFCCNSDVIREDEVPKDMKAEAEAYRQELVERVSEVDDQLAEMFIGKISSLTLYHLH